MALRFWSEVGVKSLFRRVPANKDLHMHLQLISLHFSEPLLTSLQLCLCLRYPYMRHAKDIKVFDVVPLHRQLHSSEIHLSFFCSSPSCSGWINDCMLKLICKNKKEKAFLHKLLCKKTISIRHDHSLIQNALVSIGNILLHNKSRG